MNKIPAKAYMAYERSTKARDALSDRRKITEAVARGIFMVLGLVTIGFVALITIYLIAAGLPAVREIGIKGFLFGRAWKPTATPAAFGILPIILTSLAGTAGALLIGAPVGLLTAVYLTKLAPAKLRSVMEILVSVLAGTPSVVFGLVGMLVLVPGIRSIFQLSDGSSLLAAILVLAVMILPNIIKVSMSALAEVPGHLEEGSLALGATKAETAFRVSLRAARSGVASAIVLGAGRALGEAMAVMMVSGNVANMPKLFGSVRFLTSAVATEMSYASGLQKRALFSIALVLYIFILLTNTLLNRLLKRGLSQ